MKKILCIILAPALLLTGCDDYSGAAAGSLFDEAEAFISEGDNDAAEEKLAEALYTYPSGESCVRYLTALADNGKLDFLAENFPTEDELIFRGKPLSEYDTQELLEIAGLSDKIGYREETSLSDTVYFTPDNEDGGAVMPYGITKDMSITGMLEAMGFSGEQAKLLKEVYYISIRWQDEGTVINAKKSQYAPFSQHPAEEWEFSLKYKRAEIIFRSSGSFISSFTVKVYF